MVVATGQAEDICTTHAMWMWAHIMSIPFPIIACTFNYGSNAGRYVDASQMLNIRVSSDPSLLIRQWRCSIGRTSNRNNNDMNRLNYCQLTALFWCINTPSGKHHISIHICGSILSANIIFTCHNVGTVGAGCNYFCRFNCAHQRRKKNEWNVGVAFRSWSGIPM